MDFVERDCQITFNKRYSVVPEIDFKNLSAGGSLKRAKELHSQTIIYKTNSNYFPAVNI